MIRRIIGTAALVAAAVSSANAQVQATFNKSNTGTLYYDGKGVFTSNAAAITGGFFVNNTTFQIWCVDQNHSTSGGSYTAYVSRLDGSMAKTRVSATGVPGGDASNTYAKAAYLANGMTSGNQGINQYAIWATIHGRSAGTECGSFSPSGGLGACNSGDVGTAMTAAGVGYLNINKSEWFVISDKNAWSDNYNGGGEQEFLARCQSTTPFACDGTITQEDPTPEPATMSLLALGLAGMAGSSLRRRKK